ncbi:DJ-1/PfpI family protein [Corynebacterium glyciniphilum]|uniref:DJ-1/PfpI family protein n=1 Tax=Corynebacterium glyciniphilum TaxID=1404244 RepID=UPI00235749EC
MVNTSDPQDTRTVTVLLYDDFEVLDVFGPVEFFAHVPGWSVQYAGPTTRDTVRSAQGAEVTTDVSYSDLRDRVGGTDIVLVPGGPGSRTLISDAGFLSDVATICRRASVVTSVCTGSAVLAAAGVLDGRRATSNKKSWSWATSQGRRVTWVPQARWVVDDSARVPIWTSSGVAAGMDMAHALVTELTGPSVADDIADNIELEVHRDSRWDPFASVHGCT